MPAPPTRLLGVDTGGTFTDFLLLDGDGLRAHKVLSTPSAPEAAILAGCAELGLARSDLRVVHGSTVATNAILEGRGARTAFITNRGFEDLLAIGRQGRRALYDLTPLPVPPPVPRDLCLGTGGRIGADGTLLEPLTPQDLAALHAAVERLAPEAVAICLLFSFLDDAHERRIEAALPPGLFVSRSSQVLPEAREYERGITTWLNAAVGPLMQGYLARLAQALAPARLAVMQSAGLTCDAAAAGRHAVRLLLSGPAGGLAGARAVAAAAGEERLITFDMGGTSTDVALVDGEPVPTGEGRIGDWPVAVPMADIHTIGAGGGSIAWVDAGGALQVGPLSAGAAPGPACYGAGGEAATVTDANLVLGRLPVQVRLGGRVVLDVDAARAALAQVAARLGLPDPESAALGVVRIVDERMAQALRVVSVLRGLDPRTYTLVAFGGAGGLHACDLAARLGMTRVLAPAHAGVLSALGMLAAAPGRDLARTVIRPLAALAAADIEAQIERLAAAGGAELAAEGIVAAPALHATLALRYRGQSHTLNVPWTGSVEAVATDFHAAHARRYGHRLEHPLEVVTVRLRLRAAAPPLALPRAGPAADAALGMTDVHGVAAPVPVLARERLGAGARVTGPAVAVDAGATVWLAPGWSARADGHGNLLLLQDD